MQIRCNDYNEKDIIRFMRDYTEKTQTQFAKDIQKTRSWCAKAERDEIKISLHDFLKLAKINNIDIIMKDANKGDN